MSIFDSSSNDSNISVKESRSSHQMCSLKAFLKNFAKLTGKYLCQSLFFNEVAGLRSATSLKKEAVAQVFSCDFCEIFKNTFFTEHLWATASERIPRKNVAANINPFEICFCSNSSKHFFPT